MQAWRCFVQLVATKHMAKKTKSAKDSAKETEKTRKSIEISRENRGRQSRV